MKLKTISKVTASFASTASNLPNLLLGQFVLCRERLRGFGLGLKLHLIVVVQLVEPFVGRLDLPARNLIALCQKKKRRGNGERQTNRESVGVCECV